MIGSMSGIRVDGVASEKRGNEIALSFRRANATIFSKNQIVGVHFSERLCAVLREGVRCHFCRSEPMFFQKIRAFFEWLSAKRMKQSRKALDYPWTTHQSVRRTAEKSVQEKPAVSEELRVVKPAAKAEPTTKAPVVAKETVKRKSRKTSAKAILDAAPAEVADKRELQNKEASEERARKSLVVPSRVKKLKMPEPPRGTLDWGEPTRRTRLTARSTPENILKGRKLRDVCALIEEEFPEVKRYATRRDSLYVYLDQHPEVKKKLVALLVQEDAKAHQEMLDKPLRPRKPRTDKLPPSLRKKLPAKTTVKKNESAKKSSVPDGQVDNVIATESVQTPSREQPGAMKEATAQTLDKAQQSVEQKAVLALAQSQGIEQESRSASSESKTKVAPKKAIRKSKIKKADAAAKPAGTVRRGRKTKLQTNQIPEAAEGATAAFVETDAQKQRQ